MASAFRSVILLLKLRSAWATLQPGTSTSSPLKLSAITSINTKNYNYIILCVVVYAIPSLLPRPLYYVGMEIFSEFRVAETLDIDHSVVAAWLKVV